MARRVLLYVAIALLGGILGANVYNSVVDAPNWGASIPDSMETARRYFGVANPGTFYRTVSPAAQIAALLALIAIWSAGGSARWLAAGALALAVAGDALTFAYFFPRNEILFGATFDPEALTRAWSGWSCMNHFRSAIVAAALFCELCALSAFEKRSK